MANSTATLEAASSFRHIESLLHPAEKLPFPSRIAQSIPKSSFWPMPIPIMPFLFGSTQNLMPQQDGRQNLTNMMGLAAGWPQLEQFLQFQNSPLASGGANTWTMLAEFWRRSSTALLLQQRMLQPTQMISTPSNATGTQMLEQTQIWPQFIPDSGEIFQPHSTLDTNSAAWKFDETQNKNIQ